MIARDGNGRIRAVKRYKIIGIALASLAVVAVFFEVDWPLDVALPTEVLIRDPAVEAAYEDCYAQRDDDIHTTAFGTIDNPDVQKEFIASNRAEAAADCRRAHPVSMITVAEPGRFNLLDLTPRYW